MQRCIDLGFSNSFFFTSALVLSKFLKPLSVAGPNNLSILLKCAEADEICTGRKRGT